MIDPRSLVDDITPIVLLGLVLLVIIVAKLKGKNIWR